VSLALENGDLLALSAEQVTALRELQEGMQADVVPLQAEIEELRAQIVNGAAGAEGLGRLQLLLDRFDEVAALYRTGVQNILSPEQHLTLQRIMLDSWGGGGGYVGGVGLGVGRAGGLGLGRGRGLGLRRAGGAGLGRGGVSLQGRGIGRGLGRGMGRRVIWR
jgi:hypothetical protein